MQRSSWVRARVDLKLHRKLIHPSIKIQRLGTKVCSKTTRISIRIRVGIKRRIKNHRRNLLMSSRPSICSSGWLWLLLEFYAITTLIHRQRILLTLGSFCQAILLSLVFWSFSSNVTSGSLSETCVSCITTLGEVCSISMWESCPWLLSIIKKDHNKAKHSKL